MQTKPFVCWLSLIAVLAGAVIAFAEETLPMPRSIILTAGQEQAAQPVILAAYRRAARITGCAACSCPAVSMMLRGIGRVSSAKAMTAPAKTAIKDSQQTNGFVCITSFYERGMQLLRSELQPPSAWRRKPSDWPLRLQPCDCWLVRHTTVRGRG